MTERESPSTDRFSEDFRVGEGPLYETMRAEARKLIPLLVPGGDVEKCQPYWGAGICGVSRENGKNVVSVLTLHREVRPMAVVWEASIEELRSSAISLLVYCEAHDE